MSENRDLLFKCKQCGGELKLVSKAQGICTWCHSRQTVPVFEDGQQEDKLKELYERAEFYRREGDFSNARKNLEEILKQGHKDAEIHWLLALCKFGITYVDNPTTHQQVPTFCMMQKWSSFIADADYEMALQLAGEEEKAIYTAQAQDISDMQSQIVNLQRTEPKADVFVCCDDADAKGKAIAAELTKRMKAEKIQVFYADENPYLAGLKKTEPYIFNALMSARVMLLVISSREAAVSPRVRNEWRRFLYRQKNNDRLSMIPVLVEMDSDGMPKDLWHLSLTAKKVDQPGTMTEVIREVQKCLNENRTEKSVPGQAPKSSAEQQEEIRRETQKRQREKQIQLAFQHITDGRHDLAMDLCMQVMREEPKNPHAHFCLFMMDLNLRGDSEESCLKNVIRDLSEPTADPGSPMIVMQHLQENDHFRRALRYGDEAYQAMLNDFAGKVKDLARKNAMKVSSVAREAEEHFLAAELLMPFQDEGNLAARREKHLREANKQGGKDRFEELRREADHAETFQKCQELAGKLEAIELPSAKSLAKELLRKGCKLGYADAVKKASKATSPREMTEAAALFEKLADQHYQDAESRMHQLRKTALEKQRKDAETMIRNKPNYDTYQHAAELMEDLKLPEGEKYAQQYREMAMRALNNKSGVFDRRKKGRVAARMFFTLLSLGLIGLWFYLTLNNELGERLREQLSAMPADAGQYVRTGLFTFAAGILIGTAVHFSYRRGLLFLLFTAAMLCFPINCLLTHVSPFHDVTIYQESRTVEDVADAIRSTGLEVEDSDANILPLFLLMIPGILSATGMIRYEGKARAAIGTAMCLLLLVVLADQLNYGDLKDRIIANHNDAAVGMQYVLIPLLAGGAGLVFSLLCFILGTGRGVNFLFLIAAYSTLFSWPQRLEWKIPFIAESTLPPAVILGIFLLPAFLALTAWRRK